MFFAVNWKRLCPAVDAKGERLVDVVNDRKIHHNRWVKTVLLSEPIMGYLLAFAAGDQHCRSFLMKTLT